MQHGRQAKRAGPRGRRGNGRLQETPSLGRKLEPAEPARVSSLQRQRQIPDPLLIALQRTQPLLNAAQETDLEGTPFHRAG